MGYPNWRTPLSVLEEEPFRGTQFTMNAAASHVNAGPFDRYCTPDGKWVKVAPPTEPVRLSNRSGLFAPNWEDEIVFCNPPYDHALLEWVRVALTRVAHASVLLLPPSVDTEWFHLLNAHPAVTLIWRRGRIKFWVPARKLADGSYDEECAESVIGPRPRAGNLIAVVR